jgi:hypothetical protein
MVSQRPAAAGGSRPWRQINSQRPASPRACWENISNRSVTRIRSCLGVLVGIFTSQPGFQHLCCRCLRWKPGAGPFLAGLGKPLLLAQISSLITGWAVRYLRTDSSWERNFATSGNLAVILTSPSSNLSNFDNVYNYIYTQMIILLSKLCARRKLLTMD